MVRFGSANRHAVAKIRAAALLHFPPLAYPRSSSTSRMRVFRCGRGIPLTLQSDAIPIRMTSRLQTTPILARIIAIFCKKNQYGL